MRIAPVYEVRFNAVFCSGTLVCAAIAPHDLSHLDPRFNTPTTDRNIVALPSLVISRSQGLAYMPSLDVRG